jgi:hypothetical protein
MLGADDEARQEYFGALQKTLEALEARSKSGPNMFQVAGALLDPGRTGNVGEAIGRAAGVVGAQQQRQDEMAIPIAQVRAQLAGQKYEVANQAKALQLMAATLGMPAEALQQQLQNGALPPNAMAKLSQIYPTIAQLSPKVGDIVKNAFGMHKDMASAANEDFKAGMQQADLEAKYGPNALSLIPGGGRARPGQPAATPEPTVPAPIAPVAQSSAAAPVAPAQPVTPPASPTPSTPEITQLQQKDAQLREQLRSIDPTDTTRISLINTELDSVQKKLKQFGINTASIVAAQPKPAGANDLANLPLATQAEVSKKRVEEGDKPYNQRRDEILTYTPQLLEASNTNLRQLDYFARTKPQIFALMQQQGVLSGLMTAAQEGAQLQAGDFSAKVGLPVRQFLEKVKLAPDEQQAVRDVSRILASEFLSNVRANKGLLGVNPTDNDARLLQAPMASIEDSSKAMQLWARQQILLNKQREAMYGEWSRYADTSGPTASPRKFFTPGSPYEKLNKDYSNYRMQLFKQFYPE